jgi:hypothetical protein
MPRENQELRTFAAAGGFLMPELTGLRNGFLQRRKQTVTHRSGAEQTGNGALAQSRY